MKATTQHTPTPWFTDKGKRTHVLARVDRTGENEAQICDMYNSDFIPPDEQRANSAFICRAVNSHDALVEACKLALSLCKSAALLNRQAFDSCAWETLRDAAKLRADALLAAINQAEGQ